jgi:deferrochelatase/peroxidase EfeB
VLGHPSQWADYKYPVPTPEDFGFNGSFAAYRILQQHVDQFEDCLKDEARKTGLSRELLAAKICGRWRNGAPLVLSPQFDYAVDEQMLNDFDYIDDTLGYRCPFGAHIRRTNPRDDEIAANVGSKHRIIRRGMPYGPPYDPQTPYDGHERGLLGLFICVNLRDQFEFIMKNWINQGGFHGHLPVDVKDPMMGPGYLPIPGPSGTTTIQLSQFITTRGGAYCFLPSKTGVKYIAAHS